MTFTISKKDLVYWIVIGVLIITTGLGFVAYKVGAQEGDQKIDETSGALEKSESTDFSESNIVVPPASMPIANCETKINYTTPVSNTYNANAPYNLSFFRGAPTANFQDVNGDSLPDYVWVENSNTGYETNFQTKYSACVYLNTGNGWAKAYECFATTRTNITTGQLLFQEYQGDCAGTPNSKE